MFTLSVGDYEVRCQSEGLPHLADEEAVRATLCERFNTPNEGNDCFFAISRRGEPWPFLVVIQRYSPAGRGFYPGAILIPETHLLLLGAGRRLLGYDLSQPARLWEDETDCGFWSWSRYGEVVLMMAELELAAWTNTGEKLWSRFVDPPWEYRVEGSVITVSDCRGIERIHLHTGRPA